MPDGEVDPEPRTANLTVEAVSSCLKGLHDSLLEGALGFSLLLDRRLLASRAIRVAQVLSHNAGTFPSGLTHTV